MKTTSIVSLKNSNLRSARLVLACLIPLGFGVSQVVAATHTWDGGGGNNNWTTTTNWVGDAFAPANGDTLIFSGATQQTNVNDAGVVYFGNLTFSNSGFFLGGQAVGLGNGGGINSTGANTLAGGLLLGGGGANKQITGDSLTIANVNYQGNFNSLQDSTNTGVTFTGAFIAQGIFRGFSLGETIFAGDNSAWDGTMNIYRFAKLQNNGGLGGASTTLSLDRSYANAYIDLNGYDPSGVNLAFTSAEAPGSGLRARLRNTNTADTSSFSGNISVAGYTGGVDGAGNTTLTGVISGAGGGIVKEGTGILRIGGTVANTYSAGTIVNAGTLLVNNPAGGTGTGSLVTEVGATLGGKGLIQSVTTVNGTLNPGVPYTGVPSTEGYLTVTKALTLGSTANALMEINGTSGAGNVGGTGWDFLSLTGSGADGVFTLDGTLTLDMGVTFGVGNYSWDLFNFASTSGSFDAVVLADQYSGSLIPTAGVWDLVDGNNTWKFTESTGVLGLTVVPEPSTVALLLGGIGALVLAVRRRSRD